MLLGMAATTAALYYLNVRAESAIKREVTEHADGLAEAVNVALQSMPSKIYLHEFLAQNPLRPNSAALVHHILVTDSRGIIIDSTHPQEVGRRLMDDGADVAAEGEVSLEEIRRHTEPFDPGDLRLYSFPVETSIETPEGARRERVFVHVLLLWKGIPAVLNQTSRDRLLAMGSLLSLSVLVMVFMVWRFTKPVNDLLQAQRRVARGDLNFELEIQRRDEMGNLAQTFNEMVSALRRNSELEEKLREAERSAAIGRLAAGIAHEIRNPLNFINLSMDYVRSHFAPSEEGPSQQFDEMLASVKSEIARLNRLVTDFLSFGRPSDITLSSVEVQPLIEEVCAPARAQAAERGISIEIQSGGIIPPIQADPDRLKICFSNLIINAIQAMPGRGKIQIELYREGEMVQVSLTDDGPGIPESDLERIFEPYYSTKETGIGLGLAVTRKIILDHGGRIVASNTAGHGSSFVVALPLNPHRDQAQAVEPALSLQPG